MDPKKILVVEDETLIAMDISMQLRELGYQAVGHATSGEQAIEMAGRLHPDLILMDIHLASAMNGVTASRAIQSQFGVPSILLSAFTDNDSMSQIALAKSAGYLPKPFENYQLHAAIKTAFKNQAADSAHIKK
jgi:CheY-like chemotaxis protein